MRNMSPAFTSPKEKHFSTPNTTTTPQRQNRHQMTPSLYTSPFMTDNSISPNHTTVLPPTIKASGSFHHKCSNYFRTITRPVPKEFSPVKVLFKSGFDLQEDNKLLKIQNQDLRLRVEELQSDLDKYMEYSDVFSENRKLKLLIMQIESQNHEYKLENNRLNQMLDDRNRDR